MTMSDTEKSDSSSNEEDEREVYKKYSHQQRDDFSDDDEDEEEDEDSDISFDDEDREEFDNRRQRREVFEYDEEEDDFDYDEGSSSEEFQLDYDEEDEIMQVVVDEDGKANLAIVDEYEDFDDDEDVIIPMEEQSLKTEAEIGSEIFESSPYIPPETEDRSWKSSLKDITQRYVRATLMLGKSSQSGVEREKIQERFSESRELSASSPSLHVDREIFNMTNTYVRLTRALGLGRRSRSESGLSRVSSRPVSGSRNSPVSQVAEGENLSEPRSSEKQNVGEALGNLGRKMVSITRRIGRSFSTNSLSIVSRKGSEISIKNSASETSAERKASRKDSDKGESDTEKVSSNGSIKSSADKSKSLSDICENVEMEEMKTPVLGDSLQKITEKMILVTNCILDPPERIPSVTRSGMSLTEEEESVDDHSGLSVIANIPKEKDGGEESPEKEPPTSQTSKNIHPFIEKILKREESVEISKLLVEAHKEDEERERLLEEGMTFTNALRTITGDVVTVTRLLGSNPNVAAAVDRVAAREESGEDCNAVRVEGEENGEDCNAVRVEGGEQVGDIAKSDQQMKASEVLEEIVSDDTSHVSIDIKKEIKKFTDDIIRTTQILGHVKKAQVLKVSPDDVYMKGGIDAMSCVTMEASPTRYIQLLQVTMLSVR